MVNIKFDKNENKNRNEPRFEHETYSACFFSHVVRTNDISAAFGSSTRTYLDDSVSFRTSENATFLYVIKVKKLKILSILQSKWKAYSYPSALQSDSETVLCMCLSPGESRPSAQSLPDSPFSEKIANPSELNLTCCGVNGLGSFNSDTKGAIETIEKKGKKLR